MPTEEEAFAVTVMEPDTVPPAGLAMPTVGGEEEPVVPPVPKNNPLTTAFRPPV
jgi:hypothetical protein